MLFRLGAVREKRSRAFFKSGQDLSLSYARNFVPGLKRNKIARTQITFDEKSFQFFPQDVANATSGVKGVESVIIGAVFKKLVILLRAWK